MNVDDWITEADIIDRVMTDRGEYVALELSGHEFGKIETSLAMAYYGLRSWPSHCDKVIYYCEVGVEWKDMERTNSKLGFSINP